METKTLEFAVFRDANGRPTCCKNLEEKKFCQFLRTRMMGIVEVCGFCHDIDLYRRDGGEGSLEPNKNCPFWKDEI